MSEEKRPLEEIKDVMVIEDETDVSETRKCIFGIWTVLEISSTFMTEPRHK